jgi:hypothetical protein
VGHAYSFRDGAFVDGLVADFGIPDRDALTFALSRAEDAHRWTAELDKGSEWAEAEADALDALADGGGPLWTTVELIKSAIGPIAQTMAGAVATGEDWSPISAAEDDLYALCNRLAKVGRAAEKAPRRRLDRGEHHYLEYAPIRAAVEVFAAFWVGELGRPFRNSRWVDGKPNRGGAAEFCFRAIERIAPGKGESLGTILREMKGYGK